MSFALPLLQNIAMRPTAATERSPLGDDGHGATATEHSQRVYSIGSVKIRHDAADATETRIMEELQRDRGRAAVDSAARSGMYPASKARSERGPPLCLAVGLCQHKDARLWAPKAPGSFNAYGSEGPQNRKHRPKVSASSAAAEVEDAEDIESSMYPEWHEREKLPFAEEYMFFDATPTSYKNAMFHDRARWSHAIDIRTASALASVTAHIVMPRLVDSEEWQKHSEKFFRRVCAHRRHMHGKYEAAFEQLREKHRLLQAQVERMEGVIANLEARLATTQHAGRNPGLVGDVEAGVSRGRSVPERLLEAQLTAIRARSPSPGPAALQALAEFRAR